MKQGFDTVRLGHLAWDSFERDNGVFTFEWFDRVMDLCAEMGLGVFLDLPVRPAPVWVHEAAPGCSIRDAAGNLCPPVRRYMEDVGDPEYQKYAFRFARTLIRKYRKHPALLGFGLCNEQGAGWMSYSQEALARFRGWLMKKYESVENLNCAWDTQRWSRRLRSFKDVVFPQTGIARGAPEPWLDMRRFFSDSVGEFLCKLAQIVKEEAPGIPHSSNHYSGHPDLGFDLLKYSDHFVDYPGVGHYPDYEISDQAHYTFATLQERLNEQEKPLWCLEFLSGKNSIYAGPEGYVRMQAMLCLQHRMQMLLGWTWRTMLGGEEQFYYGLLDHDGTSTPVFDEYVRLAGDFRKLEKYALPYLPQPEIAVAYSQESLWAGQYSSRQFTFAYTQAVLNTQKALFDLNRDYNTVDLRKLKKRYRLLIIPEHIVMENTAAQTVRDFVMNGGTVLMTAASAVLDENGRAFDLPLPGRLSDVFGVRVAGFERAGTLNRKGMPIARERMITGQGDSFRFTAEYVEYLELRGAECFANLENGQCGVSVHSFGRGKAYYMAAEAGAAVLTWLISRISAEAELSPVIHVPEGVQVRELAPGQRLYVNTRNGPVHISLDGDGRGVLAGRDYAGSMTLEAYDAELLISGE